MKKSLLILLVVFAFLTFGCAKKYTKAPSDAERPGEEHGSLRRGSRRNYNCRGRGHY